MLRLVIPKGSLEAQTLRLFEEADLRVRRGSDRDYHGTIDDDRVERVSILRPQEIPLYVQDGLFDLGITGEDWIAETAADVEVLTSLRYAKSGTGHGTQIVLAVPKEHPAERAADLPGGHAHLHRVRAPDPNATSRGSASTCACPGPTAPPRRRSPRSWTRSSTSPRRARPSAPTG